MMTRPRISARRRPTRWALTLIEMVISIALVGVMLVAALETVSAAKLGQRKLHDRLSGHQLAQDLMAEILQQGYADATLLDNLETEILIDGNTVTATLGPETGEDATGDRSLFDDADDYHGWAASPPQQQDGTVMSHLTGWRRDVVVQYVEDDDPSQIKTRDEGAKLITVTVTRDDLPVATLTALRTLGAPPTEACCLPDTSCADLARGVCLALGGTPGGQDTSCYTTTCRVPEVVYEEFTEAKANSDVGSIILNTPGGTTESDLLIAVVVVDGDGLLSPPGGQGWSEIKQASHGDTQLAMGVWWKLAGASEPGAHRFSWGNAGKCYGWMMRFTGHEPDNPIHAAAMNTNKSNDPECPQVNTTQNDCLILRIGGFDDDDITVDAPGLPGHEPITMDKCGYGYDTASGGAGWVYLVNAGSSGKCKFSLTDSEEWITVTVALAPNR